MNTNQPNTRTGQPLTRTCVEKILREAAFVLWLTRQTRQEILRDAASEPVDEPRLRQAEDQPPFTAA